MAQRSRLLACGLMAPALIMTGVLVQDAATPGYEATRQFVSHLSLGPFGWVNSALLVATGGLILLFAAGLRWLARTERRLRGLWVPIGVLGAGLAAAGVFTIDPGLGYPPGSTPRSSWHGTVHDIAGGVVFLSGVVGCVMTGRRCARAGGWRRVAWVSYCAAAAIVALFALTSVLAGLDYAGALRPGMAGLAERAYLATLLGWVVVLAWHSLRIVRTGAGVTPAVRPGVTVGPGADASMDAARP
jgi:Protein of unknown function (DUF998)